MRLLFASDRAPANRFQVWQLLLREPLVAPTPVTFGGTGSQASRTPSSCGRTDDSVYTFGATGVRAIYLVRQGNEIGLTSYTDHADRGDERDPVWSADCQHVVYGAQRRGELDYDLWGHSAGPDRLMRTDDDPADYRLMDLSGVERAPDLGFGTQLAFSAFGGDHGPDGEIMHVKLRKTKEGLLRADGAPRALTANPGTDFDPSFSPDGTQVAYRSNRDGNEEIYKIAVCTSGPCDASPDRLTNNGAADGQPAWSPDARLLAFSSTRDGGDRDIFTLDPAQPNPESTVTRIVGEAGTGTTDDEPGWEPRVPPPVIFLHGILGSKLLCGGDELFPNEVLGVPAPKLGRMLIEADGITDAPGSCPQPDSIVAASWDSFYARTLENLEADFPGNNYAFAYDWRKGPEQALARLDELVKRARCGGALPSGASTCAERVVLMGHSMGGLVARRYVIEHRDKVVRLLTLGTPYHGAPKALLPLAAGLLDNKWLDRLIDIAQLDDDLKRLARNSKGLYMLYPSYPDWLTLPQQHGPTPLDREQLLDFVSSSPPEGLGGNRDLLSAALNDHATFFDDYTTYGGVDYQAVVGTGLPSIESILGFPNQLVRVIMKGTREVDQDRYELTYGNGDGTVPIASAAAGPAAEQRNGVGLHYVCGVGHAELPLNARVWERVRQFVRSGAPIEDEPGSRLGCKSSGSEIAIITTDERLGGSVTPLASRAAAVPMTLEEANRAGLIEIFPFGDETIVLTDARTPVALRFAAEDYSVRTRRVGDSGSGPASFYGPLSGAVQITTAASGNVTLIRDGTPLDPSMRPKVRIADIAVDEGNVDANRSLVAELSGASDERVTVDFATVAGTAQPGEDYLHTGGTVTFNPGERTKPITIPIVGDVADEPDETLGVRLSNAVNVTLGANPATVTITDDDPPPVEVAALSVGDVTVSEGDAGQTDATFAVSLSAPSSQAATVDFATVDGAAAAPGDYAATSGTVQFAPGDTTKSVTVAVNGDRLDEPDETFKIKLTNPTNATIDDATGEGTITDDDPPPAVSIGDASVTEGDSGLVEATFEVSLSAASGRRATIDFETADGTAEAPNDYTTKSGTVEFAPGETAKTITVAVSGDTLEEPDETFNVKLTNPTNATIDDDTGVGTIEDNDVEIPPGPAWSKLDVLGHRRQLGTTALRRRRTRRRPIG